MISHTEVKISKSVAERGVMRKNRRIQLVMPRASHIKEKIDRKNVFFRKKSDRDNVIRMIKTLYSKINTFDIKKPRALISECLDKISITKFKRCAKMIRLMIGCL